MKKKQRKRCQNNTYIYWFIIVLLWAERCARAFLQGYAHRTTAIRVHFRTRQKMDSSRLLWLFFIQPLYFRPNNNWVLLLSLNWWARRRGRPADQTQESNFQRILFFMCSKTKRTFLSFFLSFSSLHFPPFHWLCLTVLVVSSTKPAKRPYSDLQKQEWPKFDADEYYPLFLCWRNIRSPTWTVILMISLLEKWQKMAGAAEETEHKMSEKIKVAFGHIHRILF